MELLRTKGESYFIRGIPKGCKFCIRGQKVVLFLNGICQKPNHCVWYCPISKERRGINVTFADEIEVKKMSDLVKEIELIKAKGISITGGEPLSDINVDKTCNYISFLKKEYGSEFHIHLYTNSNNFNSEIAQRLASVGLDEMRFHPSKENWHKIEYALDKGISVGAEVPIIPEKSQLKELKKFILYLDDLGCNFINLNEFEYCFPNSESLKTRGYYLKEGTIASVKNSEESALKLIKQLAQKTEIKIHYCPIILKDHYQLKNRYKRRARSIRRAYEVVNSAGLLVFAQVEGDQKNIKAFQEKSLNNLAIPKDLLRIKEDEILLPWYYAVDQKFLDELKQFNLKCSIIEGTPFRGSLFQITEKTPINLIIKNNKE